MSQQGHRQASFRAIGGTAGSHNEDARAAFEAEATIPAGSTFNEAFILWLQARLESSNTNLNGLLAEWAEAEGADNGAAIGPFDPSAGIIQDGLVAEWRFNEGAGTSVTDYTGNGHDGSFTDTPTWTATGLSFDGSNDYVECGTVDISGDVVRTVIIAVKPGQEAEAKDDNWGCAWIGSGGNGTRWAIRETSTKIASTADDGVRFEILGTGQNIDGGTVDAPPNQWAYIALVQAGADFNTCTYYVNAGSAALTSSAAINTAGNFRFGFSGGSFKKCEFAYGLVYNRALTAEEIATNRAVLTTILAARGITLP